MTVQEVLAEVDELKPHQFDENLMVKWLNDVEARIHKQILSNYVYEEELEEYVPLTADDMERELCIKELYTDVYKFYLFAMIDFYNNETARYQNSYTMFNALYQEFANYWNSTHRHRGPDRFKL